MLLRVKAVTLRVQVTAVHFGEKSETSTQVTGETRAIAVRVTASMGWRVGCNSKQRGEISRKSPLFLFLSLYL